MKAEFQEIKIVLKFQLALLYFLIYNDFIFPYKSLTDKLFLLVFNKYIIINQKTQ